MNTKKKTPTKTDLAQIKGEYARHSTIHGIGYIFDSYLSVVDRALSLLAVLVFLGLATELMVDFRSQWKDEQKDYLKVAKIKGFRCPK